MTNTARVLTAVAALMLAGAPAVVVAAGFAISANGLADNQMMSKDMAYDKMSSDGVHSCGGVNRAPGFTWVNPPANTQSYAILEVDPDGARGNGVNHWVIYNIPAPSRRSVAPTSQPGSTRPAAGPAIS